MARGYQRLSPQAIDEVWVRLRAGHAAKPAARQLGLPTSTVRTYLLRCGGIRPVPRRRTEGRLSLEEREEISRGVAAGLSLRAIAAQLGRAPSTVSREVAANGGRRQYRAHGSDRQAWSRATRPKACKLATNPALRAIVVEKLRVKGQGLKASRLKSRTSYRVLVLPEWCLAMLRARRVHLGAFDGPVSADSKGGYRDRNNVGRAFREVRAGTDFDWVKPHTYRKTVATLLDGSGATARMIADQLGHSRVSTQDVYLGRRSVDPSVAQALEGFDPDAGPTHDPAQGECPCPALCPARRSPRKLRPLLGL